MLYAHSIPIVCYLYFPLIFLSLIPFNDTSGEELQGDESTGRSMPISQYWIPMVAASSTVERPEWRGYTHTAWLLVLGQTYRQQGPSRREKKWVLGDMTAQQGNWLSLNHHEGWFPERYKAQERRCQKQKDGMSRKQSLAFTNLQHSHDYNLVPLLHTPMHLKFSPECTSQLQNLHFQF